MQISVIPVRYLNFGWHACAKSALHERMIELWWIIWIKSLMNLFFSNSIGKKRKYLQIHTVTWEISRRYVVNIWGKEGLCLYCTFHNLVLLAFHNNSLLLIMVSIGWRATLPSLWRTQIKPLLISLFVLLLLSLLYILLLLTLVALLNDWANNNKLRF